MCVLVVDDDALVRRAYLRALRRAGYVALEADGVGAADGLLATTHVDVVITDLLMADATGFDLMDLARRRGLDVPFLLMTGHPSLEVALAATERGAVRYLPKPVAVGALLCVLEDLKTERAQSAFGI